MTEYVLWRQRKFKQLTREEQNSRKKSNRLPIHAKSGGQLGYIPANFFGFSAKLQAENAKSILHPSHRLRQHHLRWRQHHLRWRQHHFRWKQHHFLSIFTIFCQFSPFFIDFHDLRTFVAIYILSQFTHFFRKLFLAKIAFSATSHVFCMYAFRGQECLQHYVIMSSEFLQITKAQENEREN